MYITLTDFRGQQYIVTADDRDNPRTALLNLRRQIVKGEPIACEISHRNNRGQTLTIFHGPVTLSYHYSAKDK